MMGKKEKKLIAKMWAAGILYACDSDSFDVNVDIKDCRDILNEVHAIAERLLDQRPLFQTLPEIINYVTDTAPLAIKKYFTTTLSGEQKGGEE